MFLKWSNSKVIQSFKSIKPIYRSESELAWAGRKMGQKEKKQIHNNVKRMQYNFFLRPTYIWRMTNRHKFMRAVNYRPRKDGRKAEAKTSSKGSGKGKLGVGICITSQLGKEYIAY